jgi:transcription elongation factor Elf1
MVHYGPPQQTVQRPSPVCPKCGSHRTQVVGRSNDLKTITIRCAACGERTTVEVGQGSKTEPAMAGANG